MQIQLKIQSSKKWLDTVIQHFDEFLCDHASCEKKASGFAVHMLSHYPDKAPLVEVMVQIAVEEMQHFKEVIRIMHQKGIVLQADKKDWYMSQLNNLVRKGEQYFLLDRLLIAAIVELRGYERFSMIAQALDDKPLKKFYQTIAQSEENHYQQYLAIAQLYFEQSVIDTRLQELLNQEASIVEKLPIQPMLH